VRHLAVFLCLTSFAALSLSRVAAGAALYLDWDECGPSGQQTHANSCDSNEGIQQLYCAFTLDQPLDQVLGVELVVDVQHSDPTVPAWWQLGVGGCRYEELTADGGAPAGPACTDLWLGQAAGGIQGYNVGQPFGSPSQARIKVVLSLLPNQARTLNAGTVYYAARLNLTNVKTTGTDACDGCGASACLVLNSIWIKRLPGAAGGDLFFETPAPDGGNMALWQGTANCQTVPVRRRTWGAIKSLYR